MKKIKVILAEDHTIVRKGLLSLLKTETGIEVVAEAEDGRQAIEKVAQLKPDVVVMDISMPSLNGLEATRQIKKNYSNVKVLILSVHTDEEYIFQALRAGASGYLVKKAAPMDLINAIQALDRGESFLSPSISKKVIEEYIKNASNMSETEDRTETLSGREREVVQLIAEGLSNQQLAELLHVSVKTVETHRARIMKKLDIHNTAGLTKYAVRRGWVSLEP